MKKNHKLERVIAEILKHSQTKYGHLKNIAKALNLRYSTISSSRHIYIRRFIQKYGGWK